MVAKFLACLTIFNLCDPHFCDSDTPHRVEAAEKTRRIRLKIAKDPMKYPETYEFAADVATKAIGHMKKLEIPWNPRNFMIWYEYVSNRNADLKRTVDEIVSEKQGVTTDQLEEIYSSFFDPPDIDGQNHEWSERIEEAAERILKVVTNVGEGTESYGQALKSFSGSLTDAASTDDIKALITGILSETKTMDAHVAALQAQVASSSEEIAALKQNLESARRDALTDGLTGVANRKCFDDTLSRAIEEANETGAPLSLIMLDLDHFKSFNDTHGHQVGDQVLKLLGRTLVQCVKGQDTAARYGGEEFSVILPNTALGGASSVADTIRASVAAKKLVKKGTDDEIGSISVSAGVTEYAQGETAAELIQRADDALYKAKELGRNRVISETRVDKEAAVGE